MQKLVAKLNQASFIEACNKKQLGLLLYSKPTKLETSDASVTKAIQDAVAEATEINEVSFNPDHHLQLPGHIVKLIGQRNKLERHFRKKRLPELKLLPTSKKPSSSSPPTQLLTPISTKKSTRTIPTYSTTKLASSRSRASAQRGQQARTKSPTLSSSACLQHSAKSSLT